MTKEEIKQHTELCGPMETLESENERLRGLLISVKFELVSVKFERDEIRAALKEARHNADVWFARADAAENRLAELDREREGLIESLDRHESLLMEAQTLFHGYRCIIDDAESQLNGLLARDSEVPQ